MIVSTKFEPPPLRELGWPDFVPREHEHRILVLAPTANDAGLTAEFLTGAGYVVTTVGTVETLCRQIVAGCGTVILAEEIFNGRNAPELFALMGRQPAWSDLPITLITSGGIAGAERMDLLANYGAKGNITLLERPFRPETLISTIAVAMRSRKRQYEVCNLLAELAQARDLAERASAAKDEFLAALSHELRTPLNPALLLASEAATDPTLPESVRQDFESIARNVQLEARLIDDLLDLTRITRGKLSLDLKPLNAQAAIELALGTIQPEVSEKQLTLTFTPGGADHAIIADAVRFQQILWNLLKNAVKFTPSAGTIKVETLNQDGALLIRVIDSGVGMEREELTRIFDAFVQGNHARPGNAHRFGGLGLGLAISRQLAELHGGHIFAESAGPGQGSTFTVVFSLSAHTPFSSPHALQSAKPDLSTPRGQHILLVEDHAPSRLSLAKLLEKRGYTVQTAGSIAQARALLAQGDFDLLLSDVGMPDGNPYALMREVANGRGTPGVAISGYGMENDVQQSVAAGFIAHLIKPITAHALDEVLDRLFAQPSPPASSPGTNGTPRPNRVGAGRTPEPSNKKASV